MSTIALPRSACPGIDPLKFSAGFWLTLMLVAQWAFGAYLVAFYGDAIASGELERWNRLEAFGRRPYVPGDDLGNGAFASHALGAGYVALAGALQLVPGIRRRFPRFHRWNGRMFLVTVVALSLSGYYLVWWRGSSPSTADALATSLNGLLILGFAAAAFASARRRDFAAHRIWALRLYLVSNGQWFLRVGVFAWFAGMKAAGQTPSFDDAFFHFWKVGCFLVPLALLQLWLFASRSTHAGLRGLVAGTLVGSSLAMAAGAAIYGVVTLRIVTGAPFGLP